MYMAVQRYKKGVINCSHSNGDLFKCEDCNMLFVKISCFHVKAHLVFHRWL